MEKKEEKKSNFLSKISDNTKIMFFRWWLVGAIYFFIAWGTKLGLNLYFRCSYCCCSYNTF